jgi:uncharacterized NAD(P)/FAD-binding protein YdhS
MNIAIVGGGLSGTMFLFNLAQLFLKSQHSNATFLAQNFPFRVFLIESESKHIGRGIAYSSDLQRQPK